MRKVTKTYQAYQFDELADDAKEKAISDHINLEMEVYDPEQAPQGLIDCFEEAERLQTPWFTGEIIYENMKDWIIDTIKLNKYEFHKDGSFFNI